jgi:hypothetical protein
LDSVDQFSHTFEDTSTDTPGSHDAKPALNLVHPRRSSRSKMQVEPTMPFKPFIRLSVLLRAVVVQDQVQVYLGRSFVIQSSQELEKLLMAMASVTIPDYLSCGYIQGSKQTGRPITNIIVRMPFHLSRSQWKKRLSPIQSLDLALFIHTQNQCLLWKMKIQPHNINYLRFQLLVATAISIPISFRGLNELHALY